MRLTRMDKRSTTYGFCPALFVTKKNNMELEIHYISKNNKTESLAERRCTALVRHDNFEKHTVISYRRLEKLDDAGLHLKR